ncbi:MAG: TolC family protein [Cyanobacteria bacterium J06600_6]
MGKKSQFIKLATFGTAIALSNVTLANAEPRVDAKVKQNLAREESLQAKAKLGDRISANRSQSDRVFDELIGETIAQASDSDARDTTQEIIKPAQPSIRDVENLNPSGNPLSFPTQPDEVRVDSQKPITLEQALELSLKNNKEIEQARLQVESSGFALREQKAALYPNLDLTSSLTYSNSLLLDTVSEQNIDDRVDSIVEAQQENNPDLTEDQLDAIEDDARDDVEEQFINTNTSSFDFDGGLGVTYNIYTGGQRGASIRAAEKQLRSNELDLERITEQARFETARDYYNLQNSDAQVEIQKAAVEDATQTLKDAQLLEKAGLGTRFDVLRAEVELAQAEQRLTTAIANQNISRRQLAETLSVSHSTDLSTADAIEEAGTWDLELPETIVQAFKNRAELEQFLLQREISEENRTIALSQTRPTLSARANYAVNDDFDDNFDITDSYVLGLNLQWRLFDGGASRAGARQAEKDIEIAETQFANQRNQIRFAVEQAFFQLKSNQNNIGTATKEVELAEESLRLARLRFQAGVGTQTDVIEAQTQLTTARGNLLGSITDYNQSYAALTRQVSNTPDNGLQDLP